MDRPNEIWQVTDDGELRLSLRATQVVSDLVSVLFKPLLTELL